MVVVCFANLQPEHTNPCSPQRWVNFCMGRTSRLMHRQPLSLVIGVLDGSAHYQLKFHSLSLHTIPTTLLRDAFVHKQHPWPWGSIGYSGFFGCFVLKIHKTPIVAVIAISVIRIKGHSLITISPLMWNT